MSSSVHAHSQRRIYMARSEMLGSESRIHRAKQFTKQGQALLQQGAWRPAKAAFDAAIRTSPLSATWAADAYDAIGDAAPERKQALDCHRAAKRYYKHFCRRPDAPAAISPAGLGRVWLALATQYAKLSQIKIYDEHDTNRAIASFAQALQHTDNIDRPTGYRGRLDATIAWLAQHRREHRWTSNERLCARRTQAWADAVILVRAPAWSQASTSTWEAVAALGALCTDRTSARVVEKEVLPLLEAALTEAPRGVGHGNPWQAALTLLSHHRDCLPSLYGAMQQAVRANMVAAEHVPVLLACYDTALAVQPERVVQGAADLTVLQGRFWDVPQLMGNLVFTAGRFLEAAEQMGDVVAGTQAMLAIAAVGDGVPDKEAARLAVYMLGYLARRLPDHAPALIEQLAHVAQVHHRREADVDAQLQQSISAALDACGKKPSPRHVRRAARTALARVNALGWPTCRETT